MGALLWERALQSRQAIWSAPLSQQNDSLRIEWKCCLLFVQTKHSLKVFWNMLKFKELV